MRVLFLPRYTDEGPSSRYRTYHFVPYLEAAGINCVVAPLFREGYLSLRFGKKERLLLRTLGDYWNRLHALRAVREFDLIVIEKEVFPYLPPAVAKRLLDGGPPIVLDYDDAVFHRYDSHSSLLVRLVLGTKIPRLMAQAKAVVVGSDYLYKYASRYCRAVYWLPTAIDLRRYPNAPPQKAGKDPFTVGWIGSSSSAAYLDSIVPVLDEFCAARSARFLVIGGDSRRIPVRGLVQVPWSQATEVEGLSAVDVGIMPLPDTPFARGKCAFKLIQYMGCWRPTIASPVGENSRVVEQGVNGLLAATAQDWRCALETLYSSPALGQEMGRRGRAKVEAEYSLAVTGPRLAAILAQAVH